MGVVYDNHVLRIEKKSKDHFCRKHQGYGVDPLTCDEGIAEDADTLELVGYDGETFRLKIADFMLAAIPDDLGMGKQLFCSVKSLRFYTRQYCATVTPSPEYSEPTQTQMSLFEWRE